MQLDLTKYCRVSATIAVLALGSVLSNGAAARAAVSTATGLTEAPKHLFLPPRTGARQCAAPCTTGTGAATAQGPRGPIAYNGGTIMTQPRVYLIYWLPSNYHFEQPYNSTNAQASAEDTHYMDLMTQFTRDLNGSSYYNTVTQYWDSAAADNPQNSVTVAGTYQDTTSALPTACQISTPDSTTFCKLPEPATGSKTDPLTLPDSIPSEINRAIQSQGWPSGGQNNYFMLFTPYYVDDGSGGACGYHSAFSNNGGTSLNVVYGWVQDSSWDPPTQKNAGCVPTPMNNTVSNAVIGNGGNQYTANAGGDIYNDLADAEVSTLAHEIGEGVPDTDFNTGKDAWIDPSVAQQQGEVGDLCDSTYPNYDSATNSNLALNGRKYAAQALFSNLNAVTPANPNGNACVMSLNRPAELTVTTADDLAQTTATAPAPLAPICSYLPGSNVNTSSTSTAATATYGIRCGINDANNDAATTGGPSPAAGIAHTIDFTNCAAPCSIGLSSALPTVQNGNTSLTINGGNNTTLDGTSAGAGVNGLTIQASNATIRGLTVKNFAGNGIAIQGGKADLIGGTGATDGNVISNNGGDGVLVGGSATDGSRAVIDPNLIFANTGGGIILNGQVNPACSTAAPNPAAPNGNLACPVVTSVTSSAIQGKACSGCLVEVFGTDNGSAGANGQGKTFLGSTTADTTGVWTLNAPFKSAVAPSATVTATATDLTNNETSEFSQNVPFASPTATHVSRFSVFRVAGGTVVRWRVASNANIAGFRVTAGKRALTSTIPPHRSAAYSALLRWYGAGRITLHVLFRNGQQETLTTP